MADRGWSRRFDDPIPLPPGRQLVTPRDAALYITKLPKATLLTMADANGPSVYAVGDLASSKCVTNGSANAVTIYGSVTALAFESSVMPLNNPAHLFGASRARPRVKNATLIAPVSGLAL